MGLDVTAGVGVAVAGGLVADGEAVADEAATGVGLGPVVKPGLVGGGQASGDADVLAVGDGPTVGPGSGESASVPKVRNATATAMTARNVAPWCCAGVGFRSMSLPCQRAPGWLSGASADRPHFAVRSDLLRARTGSGQGRALGRSVIREGDRRPYRPGVRTADHWPRDAYVWSQ